MRASPPVRSPRPGQEFVGRAWKGTDGIVRWVTGLSKRSFLNLLWLAEDGTWHHGGIMQAGRWLTYAGEEVEAPKAGEHYRLCGVLGRVETYQVGGGVVAGGA